MTTKATRNLIHETIYHAAQAKGALAGQACTPTPMVVQEHENMLDDTSPVRKSYHVPGGVCGFAWVMVRPGNSSFARWLKEQGLGRTDSYRGGVCIWVRQYGQSMEQKQKHAEAMAAYLCKVGIKAYADSRMD